MSSEIVETTPTQPSQPVEHGQSPMKRRVIVLFGGQSAEHEVSCTSAVAVLKALDQNRYDITAIGITPSGSWVHSESAVALLAGSTDILRLEAVGPTLNQSIVLAEAAAPAAPAKPAMSAVPAMPANAEATAAPTTPAELTPVVLPVLHGPFGEDGTVQGLLELAGVPYVGSGVLGSAVSMDKAVAKELLRAAGLQQAGWRAKASWEVATPASREAFVEEIETAFGWPVFVKPANLGSSVGVSKADSPAALAVAIDLAFSYDDWIVVEEAIFGREIEFAVLGNEHPEVSVAGEIIPGADFYDYEDKYLKDDASCLIPAPLSPDELAEGQRLAVLAYKALRCEGMARVDFFFDDGSRGGNGSGWIVNEANTIPGFTPISMYPKMWAASGLSYPHLIDKLVNLAVARHARRSGRVGRGR